MTGVGHSKINSTLVQWNGWGSATKPVIFGVGGNQVLASKLANILSYTAAGTGLQ